MLLLERGCVDLAVSVGDLLGVVPNDFVYRLDPVNLVLEHREVVGVREPGLAHLASVVQLQSDSNALLRSLDPEVLGVSREHLLEQFQVARARAGNDEFHVAESDFAVQYILDAIGQRQTDHDSSSLWFAADCDYT